MRTDGEFVKAEHVHDAHVSNHAAEQVRTLQFTQFVGEVAGLVAITRILRCIRQGRGHNDVIEESSPGSCRLRRAGHRWSRP